MVRSFEALRLPAFPDVILCPHCLFRVEMPAGWKHLACCPICYLGGHSVGKAMECKACDTLGRLPAETTQIETC